MADKGVPMQESPAPAGPAAVSSDERTWAALAHATILLSVLSVALEFVAGVALALL